jgi:hypothetical protein
MTRRRLLQTGALAAAAAPGAARSAPPKPAKAVPEWYELRTIKLRIGQTKVVEDFLSQAALPALRRAGAGPIGVFRTSVGPDMPTMHMVIPWPSLAAFEAAQTRLAADAAYRQSPAAVAYHATAATTPAFVRIESSLLSAFENVPKLVPPPATEIKTRVYELRTYESPSEAAHHKKMEMFTKLGETEIFRRVGLTPVFFGRTVIGPRQPSFVYMLVFDDSAARERAWATFRGDAEWTKLKSTPGYSDADIMSNITDLLLAPTAYSQY